ncbi:hypothetical protein Pmar_PMAR003488 [Perkinsus marinus ATCC 50983]|uniref:Uncharacterized protein n=1 Tax=Perkinsus marinus (strain ATCC 50983 / TXsc) TaxID=423536 RepID=C5KHG3_PERM5|nr:hypothetical protein Pmar_PMAR003488 [Perkinsus marinus ATCC 50983]EER16025.1 hypothetical protein Pmar_PMAR003488 [Perkinsus marinus ATCC 50983]|eukprot:XP_002784229.1 hypothetical protein Pmar_PMAR003488 [Perkinsus marinus ATCC 50983]
MAMARSLTRALSSQSVGTQWVKETLKEEPKSSSTTETEASRSAQASNSSGGGSWLTEMLKESEEREKKMEKDKAAEQGDSVLDHGDVARKVYEYSHKRAEKERAEKQRKAMEKVQPKKDKK